MWPIWTLPAWAALLVVSLTADPRAVVRVALHGGALLYEPMRLPVPEV